MQFVRSSKIATGGGGFGDGHGREWAVVVSVCRRFEASIFCVVSSQNSVHNAFRLVWARNLGDALAGKSGALINST